MKGTEQFVVLKFRSNWWGWYYSESEGNAL